MNISTHKIYIKTKMGYTIIKQNDQHLHLTLIKRCYETIAGIINVTRNSIIA